MSACSGESAGGLQVDNARIRELIPGQDKTAGYFDVSNTTTEPIVIVQAESAAARAIEFHTTRLDGGVMRIAAIDRGTHRTRRHGSIPTRRPSSDAVRGKITRRPDGDPPHHS